MSSTDPTTTTTSTTTTTTVDAPTGDYVVADGVTATSSTKKGHLFCGICDTRLATFFVNAINIVMMILSIFVAAFRGPMFWKSLGGAMVLGLPGLILSGLGLYGAHQFEFWAVALATAGFVACFLVDAIMMQWLVLPILALVIYPHAFLAYELKTGIMTPETYATTEEYLVPEGKTFVESASSYVAPKTMTEI